MADQEIPFIKEAIADEDSVFLRVHFQNVDFQEKDESKNIRPVALHFLKK
jgi:hypothetical protein